MNTHPFIPPKASGHGGFTLIELMIVVAILAILAAIAIPSYNEQVRRGRRADAQAQLLMAAQFLERSYTQTGTYATTLPAGLTQSPPTGTSFYNITFALTNPTNTAFTLTAAPVGSMVGDKCGSFLLDSTNAKRVNVASVALEECWRR